LCYACYHTHIRASRSHPPTPNHAHFSHRFPSLNYLSPFLTISYHHFQFVKSHPIPSRPIFSAPLRFASPPPVQTRPINLPLQPNQISFITAFGLLLLLRLNDSIAPSLVVLLIPLWVIDGIIFCCIAIGFALSRSRASSLAIALAQLLAILAFQVLLCFRLDGVFAISYAVVFTPLFGLEAILAVRSAIRCQPSVWDAERVTGNTMLPYGFYVVRMFSWVVARASVLILLALRLDGMLSILWTVVLLPFSFLLALELFLSYSEMRSDSPSERGPVLRQLAGSRILLIIFFAIILLLLCLRLDQGSVTWISIFWPFFVASGIYFCCCCCLCCALSLAPRPEARDVPPAESTSGGKAPPPTPSPTVLSAPSNCSGKAEEVPLLANQHGNYRTGGSILPAADAV